MDEITYYGIAELGADDKPVNYVPPFGLSQNPGTPYWLTTNLAEAWRFPDKQTAEEFAEVLSASNPGRRLGVIEIPA
jgi:hypothetical protein